MPVIGRASSFLFVLLALAVPGWSDVNYTISGTLSKVSGGDPLMLDGDFIEAHATLTQAGSPSTNASSSSLTINNVTEVYLTVNGGTPLPCSDDADVALTDNVSGADSLSIQSCRILVVNVIQADVTLTNGGLSSAVPASFSSVPVTGTVTVNNAGNITTYALQNGSASADGDPPPAISPSPSSWSPSAPEGSNTVLNQSVSLSATWPVSYTTSDDAPWLSVTPSAGNTTTSLNLSANPTGLAAGIYNGTVTVSTAQGTAATIPVTFTINAPPKALTSFPTSMTFNHTIGLSPPVSQDLIVETSPASATNVNVSVTSGNSWLSVTPGSGTTPDSFDVSVNPAGQSAGVLIGNIQITASGVTNSPLNIPVTFNITGSTLSVPGTPLTFNYTIGGSTPPSQQVNVGGTSGIGFTTGASTQSGGNWLSVTPPSGTVSQNISISVNPAGLSAGTYNGSVTVTSPGATGSPATIPVSIVVTQPTLNVTPNPLTFNYQTGGSNPPGQVLNITGTNVSSFNAVAASTGNWLSVTAASGAVPGSTTVNVNPAGLGAGAHNGTVTISATGATPVVVNVTLNVTAAPTITATPGTLTFNYQIGGSIPAAQDVSIGGTAGLVYTLSDNQPWLNLSNGGGTTPGTVSASINPAGLGVGAHNATITVTAAGASNSPQTVTVTLNVTPQPALDVAPGSLTFNYQIGGATPPGQALSIGGTGVSSFTAVAGGGAWLSVNPGSGAIPGSGTTVNVNPAGLTPNTYNGTVTISAAGANPVIVNVTFNVTPAPTISATPDTLTFNYQIGGSIPSAQQVNIGGTAGVAYTLSDNASWLNLSSAGGTTPGSVSASVDPAGLDVGTYAGTITVTAPGASNSPRTVAVTLNVTPEPDLDVSPSTLNFSYQIGGSNPAGQQLSINGTAVSSFTAVAGGGAWLSVTPGSGSVPGSVTVNADPTGLAANTYNGTVTISAPGADPVVVNVSFLVTNAPTISATPSTLTFNYQIGGSVPAAQQVDIGGSAGLAYTLSDDAAWLNLSSGGGTTPGVVSVSVNPAGLEVGSHVGTITVTAAGAANSPQTVTVTLNVTPAPALDVSPGSLNFSYQIGGANPAGQALTINGTAVSSFTAVAAGGAWLSVSPGSGIVPGSVTVTVNPTGLAANTYNGTVTISAPGATPVVVNVTFVVTAAPTISATPGTLTFNYQIGGSAPAAQQVDIGGTPGLAYTLSDDAPWLNLSSAGGTTPGNVMASINTAGLTAGTYNATITVTAAGASNSPQTVAVTLNVTAQPTLNVAPGSLSFVFQIGGSNPAGQVLNITGTATPFTAVAASSGWLSVTSGGGSVPGSTTVNVNPTGLSENTYNGTVTVSASGATPVVVNVSLVVTNALLSVTPESLTFNYQIGGSVPAAQQVNIGGTAGLAYTVSDNATWLNLSSAGGTTPGNVSASINPAGLAVGTYNGTITVASAGAGNSPRTVAVTLNVTQQAKLNVSPTSLSFNYQIGGANPAGQALNITGTGVATFTAAAAGGAWLSVNPGNGSVPGSVTVTANPSGLAAGTYNGTVTIAGPGATPVVINVTLLVTPGTTISATPGTITFEYQEGGALPDSQDILIAGTSGITYSVLDNASWLSLSPAGGTTPSVISASVNPTGLGPGTYSATISVVAQAASNSPQSVAVVFHVEPAPSINAAPKTLTFSYQSGGPKPEGQMLNITGIGVANFSVAVSGATWLSTTPSSGTVPGSILVNVNPADLAPNTYTGTLTISTPGLAPAVVLVHLLVAAGPSISATPGSLQFSYRTGGPLPTAQNLTLGGTPSLAFTLAEDAPWLSLGTVAGETPRVVPVSVDPLDLAPGTYTANILVSAPGALNNPHLVEVTLDVAPPALLEISPSSLVFHHQAGAANPPNQSLQISGTSGQFSAAASGGAWLSATPASGTLPGTVIVSVNASGLSAGTYQGTVTISVPGVTPRAIGVTLNVSSNPQISTSSSKLTFHHAMGGPEPPDQTLTIGGTNGLQYTITAGNALWLSVSPLGGTVPGSATVSIAPQGLEPGTYTSTLNIVAPDASNSPVAVQVELVITAQEPVILSVSSFAAIEYPGNAPGQLVFIQGENMGPDAAVYFGVNQDGKIPNILASTRVYLNDIPAIPLMTFESQAIAILPFSAPTQGTARLQIEHAGRKSASFTIPMSPAAIRLLTVEGTGKGPALALNPDGTLNSATNPAPRDSYIALYATGGGQVTPTVVAGDIAGLTLSWIDTQPVSAMIGDLPAEVLYSGSAPTLAYGVYQFNLKLSGVSGALPVRLRVGESTSQPDVVIFVQ